MIKRLLTASLLLVVATASIIATAAEAERLVLLHTNDTHSAIDPDRDSGLGGVLRRKAAIDSVRAAEPNVLLIDAGDAVQGSLYFMLFGGDVERRAMNALGYDIAMLGNHEFDNGLERLAANYRGLDAELLSSNYDFIGTPLEGLFLPYSIRQYGDKRIAFMAININPEGLIDSKNTVGLGYRDGIATANELARLLREKEHADIVVAMTHIGYTSDSPDEPLTDRHLAEQSTDIDIIIGGHSHTLVHPTEAESIVTNAAGRPVLVTQTGKSGRYLGEITIDLATGTPSYRLIPIDARLDKNPDPELAAMIADYRVKVDSIASIRIGRSAMEMPSSSQALLNWASDVVMEQGSQLIGRPVDLSIMNKGGLRASLPKGNVTRGDVMNIFPFDNRVVVVEMKGSQLRGLFNSIAARGGNGVSANVDVLMDQPTGTARQITVNGQPVDDEATYYVATIDYLAKGNDYMTEFAACPVIARMEEPLFDTYIRYIEQLDKSGKKLKADSRARMHY